MQRWGELAAQDGPPVNGRGHADLQLSIKTPGAA
jgi:hypothetical protein